MLKVKKQLGTKLQFYKKRSLYIYCNIVRDIKLNVSNIKAVHSKFILTLLSLQIPYA
jgi:hypothetical protein